VPCAQAPGSEAASTVISFAQKTFVNGTLTSKLHVIELGAAPGVTFLFLFLSCVSDVAAGCKDVQVGAGLAHAVWTGWG
jgi:hypothetical protein